MIERFMEKVAESKNDQNRKYQRAKNIINATGVVAGLAGLGLGAYAIKTGRDIDKTSKMIGNTASEIQRRNAELTHNYLKMEADIGRKADEMFAPIADKLKLK